MTSPLSPIEVMTKHYLLAALWAEAPEGTQPRATKSAQVYAQKACQQFLTQMDAAILQRILDNPDYGVHPDYGRHHPKYAALGLDLYLTSARCGVGLKDRWLLPKRIRQHTAFVAQQQKAPTATFYRGWMYLN